MDKTNEEELMKLGLLGLAGLVLVFLWKRFRVWYWLRKPVDYAFEGLGVSDVKEFTEKYGETPGEYLETDYEDYERDLIDKSGRAAEAVKERAEEIAENAERAAELINETTDELIERAESVDISYPEREPDLVDKSRRAAEAIRDKTEETISVAADDVKDAADDLSNPIERIRARRWRMR